MGAEPINDQDFENDVINSGDAVLIDFWAEWCGPCKNLAPIVDEIASEYEGKVQVRKLNIDENPDTPSKFQVRGIPTLMLFKDGKLKASKVGSLPKSSLQEWLDSELSA